MASKKEKVVLPRTLADEHAEMSARFDNLAEQQKDLINRLRKDIDDRFAAAGGCTECGGRGWVVVWDTMDYMDGSAAEFGSCPNPACTPETREASGMSSRCSRYDARRGVADPVITHPAYGVLVSPISALMAAAHTRMVEIARNSKNFRKGDKVVVVRGRKQPIGLVAHVAFIHANGGILLKTADKWNVRGSDAIGWVNATNIEKLAE